MNKMIIAGIAGAFLAASGAMASEAVKLTDGQMDEVTAGSRFAIGGGFSAGSFVGTFGPGFGTSTTTNVGNAGFADTFVLTTGGVGISSIGYAEGGSTTSTGYAALGGGFSKVGPSLGGGAVYIGN